MKNKNAYLIANLIIIFMALAVFLGIQTNEYAYFKELAFKQAQNDAEMAAVDINAQITNFSLSQRVAGEMMANDLFLKEWCMEETNDVDSAHHQVLYRYLKNYKEKYDYDVVFLFQTKPGIITMTEASTGLSLRRLILMYGILIFLISKVTMIYRLTEMR